MNPDMPLCFDFDMIREYMAVIATDYQKGGKSSSWVFTPVHVSDVSTLGHPLAGHRQFGIIENDNGTFTFFIRGVDKPYTFLFDASNRGQIFSGAKELWQAFQKNIMDFVNNNGGKVTMGESIDKQLPEKEVEWGN